MGNESPRMANLSANWNIESQLDYVAKISAMLKPRVDMITHPISISAI